MKFQKPDGFQIIPMQQLEKRDCWMSEINAFGFNSIN